VGPQFVDRLWGERPTPEQKKRASSSGDRRGGKRRLRRGTSVKLRGHKYSSGGLWKGKKGGSSRGVDARRGKKLVPPRKKRRVIGLYENKKGVLGTLGKERCYSRSGKEKPFKKSHKRREKGKKETGWIEKEEKRKSSSPKGRKGGVAPKLEKGNTFPSFLGGELQRGGGGGRGRERHFTKGIAPFRIGASPGGGA